MNANTAQTAQNVSSTVLKALDVLEAVAAAGEPVTAPRIVAACGITRPTAFRLLSTLALRGYLTSDGTGKYRLHLKVLDISQRVLDQLDIPRRAHVHMVDLVQKTGETVHLGILDGLEVRYIGKAESPQPVRMVSRVGDRSPLYCTAMGKVLTAFMDPTAREDLLQRISLISRTQNTITNREALASHLEQVRAKGAAMDDIENEDGIRCIGVPVFGYDNTAIAAISVSAPAFRFSRRDAESVISALKQASDKIRRDLGITGAAFDN